MKNTERKPFRGDLRETILKAIATAGGGTVAGYLDKVASEHAGTKLAKQALDLKRRWNEAEGLHLGGSHVA
jgi:hypothetical protein